MAVRPIGQEVLRFGAKASRPASLDELQAAIDFAPAERALASLYPSTMGEKAWPPLAMFKALLLATWYDLSDVMLAEALADRASFRRFLRFCARRSNARAHGLCPLPPRAFSAWARSPLV